MVLPRCPRAARLFLAPGGLAPPIAELLKSASASGTRIRLNSRTMSPARKSHPLSSAEARRIWLRAQRLDTPAPFGEGAPATAAALEHLGYVQIDAISVIERSHHHILWTRIPEYRRARPPQAPRGDPNGLRNW